MPACVRMVVGEEEKVVHVNLDSLYHPHYEEQEFYRELLEVRDQFYIEGVEDAEVLVVFHAESYPYNHPSEPIEYETRFIIDQVIVMQKNYKEHWRRHITLEHHCSSCNIEEDKLLNKLIEEWQLAYDEDFTLAEDVGVY